MGMEPTDLDGYEAERLHHIAAKQVEKVEQKLGEQELKRQIAKTVLSTRDYMYGYHKGIKDVLERLGVRPRDE